MTFERREVHHLQSNMKKGWDILLFYERKRLSKTWEKRRSLGLERVFPQFFRGKLTMSLKRGNWGSKLPLEIHEGFSTLRIKGICQKDSSHLAKWLEEIEPFFLNEWKCLFKKKWLNKRCLYILRFFFSKIKIKRHLWSSIEKVEKLLYFWLQPWLPMGIFFVWPLNFSFKQFNSRIFYLYLL